MPNIRAEHSAGEWNISKHEFYTAYHYALQYNEWRDRRDALIGINAVANDGMPHGTTVGNPTEQTGIQLSKLDDKMKVVEDICREAAPDIYSWLLKAVTNEHVTYVYLSTVMSIPCGKKYYYNRRRKFYYLLSKKINEG